MKKVNIRRDVESRNEIMNGIPKRIRVAIPKVEVTNDAESEEIRGYEVDKEYSRKKRRKQGGRPKGTYKRFRFEETKPGFFLKYEVPVVYEILLEMSPLGRFFQPPYLLIKLVCEGRLIHRYVRISSGGIWRGIERMVCIVSGLKF